MQKKFWLLNERHWIKSIFGLSLTLAMIYYFSKSLQTTKHSLKSTFSELPSFRVPIKTEDCRIPTPFQLTVGSSLEDKIYEEYMQKEEDLLKTIVSTPTVYDVYTNVERAFNVFFPGWNCEAKKRYGKIGDGGKWICNPHLLGKYRPCVVYSFGGNRDNSFETELLQEYPDCSIHIFDPTPGIIEEMQQTVPESIKYHNWGLSNSSETIKIKNTLVPAKTLRDTMKTLGHSKITVLKIDIESSEWKSMEEIFHTGFPPVSQVLMEVHYRGSKDPLASLLCLMNRMKDLGFRLFSREDNPKSAKGLEYAWVYVPDSRNTWNPVK